MGVQGRDLFSVFIDRMYTDILEAIGSMISATRSKLSDACGGES